jgi:hypothetical protein
MSAQDVSLARALLADADTLADARQGRGTGNTIAGSVMSLVYRIPRQYAEAAVEAVLAEQDRGRRKVRR